MKRESKGVTTAAAERQPLVDLEAGRRAFVQSLGFGAVGSALLGTVSGAEAAAAPTPAEVLTFALNLEYLEAEFYLRAFTGNGLPASDIGPNPGQVRGGKKVPFKSAAVKAYAEEIATDEKHHVEFLRSALADAGEKVISRPPLNLGSSFTTAARAAGLIGNSETFDAYANDANFLLAAYIFEDVGVTAYHGAAGFLINTPYLSPASKIYAVEGYHAGLIRTILFENEKFRETQLISNLRQSLGPVSSALDQPGKDAGVQTIAQPNVVLGDALGAAFERTPRDVLNVVYGAKNVHKGLFFPSGLNGPIS